jgi:hypothetical protein
VRARTAILIVAATLIAARSLLPAGVFWISDAGNKYLVAENFVAGGFAHVAIGYPAAELDPGFRWFPTAGEHFRRVGAQFFSIVSFVFPLLNAPFVALLGEAGATILPLLGGIGVLALVPRIARAAGVRDDAATIVAVALATPLAFYALDFWENTLAAFLALAAIALLLRQRAWLAGGAVGLSCALREEGYVFLVALGIAVAMRERRAALRLLAGAAAVIVPLLVAQQLIYGNPLGLHLAVHTAADGIALPERLARNVFYFLLQFHERTGLAGVLALAPVAAIIVGAVGAGERARLVAQSAVLVAAAAGLALIVLHGDPITNTRYTQGLLLFLPFSVLFATRWRELVSGGPDRTDDVVRLLARTVCIYVAVMPLVLRANWSGIIWGPRYFVVITPLLVIVSLAAIDRSRRARAMAVALFAVAIALELHGLVLLQRKLAATARLRDAVRGAAPVVVTDVFWLPEELGSLYFEKQILMPPTARECSLALRTLRSRGVERVTVVTSRAFGSYGPALAPMAVRRTAMRTEGVPLLDVELYDLQVR